MFTQNNNDKNPKTVVQSNVSSSLNTIGAGTSIEGQIKCDGDIRIDGNVKGTVTSKAKIVVGPTGVIEGDLICENADVSGKVKVKGPGWLLIRAGSNAAHPDLPDLYPFATTNPIWISVPGNPVYISSKSGALFSGWVERLEKIVREFSEFRAESERKLILENIGLARAFYKAVEVKGIK